MCECVQKCLFPSVAAVEVTCVCSVTNSPGTNEPCNKSEWPMHRRERKNQGGSDSALAAPDTCRVILDYLISLGMHDWCFWESRVSCWFLLWNVTSDKPVQTVGTALTIMRYWTRQSWAAHGDPGQTSGPQCPWTPATTQISVPGAS